ncbi:beta-1,3-glucanase family protein [Dactylosporangium sp. NPDC050588]|uniref:beta-1,3-glucanase family protein n=1 Tax=Dactylosporangium sp. NPDC050588 TaxID=3157211 RepID=UPI0033C65B93
MRVGGAERGRDQIGPPARDAVRPLVTHALAEAVTDRHVPHGPDDTESIIAARSGSSVPNSYNYTSFLGYNVSTGDVFGCAGSLANNAALCGALNRHVAQLPQSQWGDVGRFYQSAPANYYARFWHNHAIGSKAYGFPYDDAADQSSFIALNNPQYMLIAVGW